MYGPLSQTFLRPFLGVLRGRNATEAIKCPWRVTFGPESSDVLKGHSFS
jgi:hypothetical protein